MAAWVFELTQLEPKKKAVLEKLTADARDVAAAQASVAKFGIEGRRLLSVLAWDGSETSADILLANAHAAVKGQTEILEDLHALVVPYARGPALAPILAALQKTNAERPEAPELAALLERLGLPQQPLTFSFRLDSAAQYSPEVVHCSLNSRSHPAVSISVHRFKAKGNLVFEQQDRKVIEQSLKLPKLASLEAFPKWLVAVEKAMGVRWREPMAVKSSLKGKDKRRVLDWLAAR